MLGLVAVVLLGTLLVLTASDRGSPRGTFAVRPAPPQHHLFAPGDDVVVGWEVDGDPGESAVVDVTVYLVGPHLDDAAAVRNAGTTRIPLLATATDELALAGRRPTRLAIPLTAPPGFYRVIAEAVTPDGTSAVEVVVEVSTS